MIQQIKNLPKQLNEQKLYEMAVTIRKYQNHKTSIAASKLDENLTLATRKNYVTWDVTYLKDGKKVPGISGALCEALDKVKSECIQPLTPSESERRRTYNKKFTRKDNIPPVAKLDIVKKPLIAKLSYGVRIEDSIKCMPSYDEAVGFLKGIKYMGDTNSTLVSFEGLEEVK